MGAFFLLLGNNALRIFWNVVRWVSINPFVISMALLLALLISFYVNSRMKTALRTAKETVRVQAGQVAGLQTDTTAYRTTIRTATAKITVNYAQQAQQIVQDSLRAAALSDDALDAENDSLLSVNRAYVRARAQRRNQPAAAGLQPAPATR